MSVLKEYVCVAYRSVSACLIGMGLCLCLSSVLSASIPLPLPLRFPLTSVPAVSDPLLFLAILRTLHRHRRLQTLSVAGVPAPLLPLSRTLLSAP